MDLVEYATHTLGRRVGELKEKQHDKNGTTHTLCHHVN